MQRLCASRSGDFPGSLVGTFYPGESPAQRLYFTRTRQTVSDADEKRRAARPVAVPRRCNCCCCPQSQSQSHSSSGSLLPLVCAGPHVTRMLVPWPPSPFPFCPLWPASTVFFFSEKKGEVNKTYGGTEKKKKNLNRIKAKREIFQLSDFFLDEVF